MINYINLVIDKTFIFKTYMQIMQQQSTYLYYYIDLQLGHYI